MTYQFSRRSIHLVCRLHQKEAGGPRGPIPYMGELELVNLSPAILEIPYQMSPLQYLELKVTGPKGEMVSEGRYSDRFSPQAEEQVLRLVPGESFRSEVPLLSTVPRDKRKPGNYHVQAIYGWNGLQTASNVVTVAV